MRKTNIFLLRDNLASYLNDVVESETPLLVCKFNKPLVLIVPAKKNLIEESYEKFFGFMGKGERGKQLINRVRRSRKEKAIIERLRKSL